FDRGGAPPPPRLLGACAPSQRLKAVTRVFRTERRRCPARQLTKGRQRPDASCFVRRRAPWSSGACRAFEPSVDARTAHHTRRQPHHATASLRSRTWACI